MIGSQTPAGNASTWQTKKNPTSSATTSPTPTSRRSATRPSTPASRTPTQGETYHDPEGDGEETVETEGPPGGEDGAQAASPGEAEGGERVPKPDSERLANREDT